MSKPPFVVSLSNHGADNTIGLVLSLSKDERGRTQGVWTQSEGGWAGKPQTLAKEDVNGVG